MVYLSPSDLSPLMTSGLSQFICLLTQFDDVYYFRKNKPCWTRKEVAPADPGSFPIEVVLGFLANCILKRIERAHCLSSLWNGNGCFHLLTGPDRTYASGPPAWSEWCLSRHAYLPCLPQVLRLHFEGTYSQFSAKCFKLNIAPWDSLNFWPQWCLTSDNKEWNNDPGWLVDLQLTNQAIALLQS